MPKTVKKNIPNTDSARKTPLQCQTQQSRRYVNASANSLNSRKSELKDRMRSKILFLGPPNCLLFTWPPRWGSHFGSRFGAVFSRNACRMREQLCQIDNHDPINYQNAPSEILWFLFFPRVIRLTLCLPLLPGLGRCPACQHDHHTAWPLLRQPDWW